MVEVAEYTINNGYLDFKTMEALRLNLSLSAEQ